MKNWLEYILNTKPTLPIENYFILLQFTFVCLCKLEKLPGKVVTLAYWFELYVILLVENVAIF